MLGATLLGLHIAATHGPLFGLLAACIPVGVVPGVGRISGTAWALTDVLMGAGAVA